MESFGINQGALLSKRRRRLFLALDRNGLKPHEMRPFRSLFLYFILVFVGGALLAPWLYRATVELGEHSAIFAKFAANPFHRFVARSLLGIALPGLWPLLRSCKMLHWSDLGLRARGQPMSDAAFGF